MPKLANLKALSVSWRRQAGGAHQRLPRAPDGRQQPSADRQGLQAAEEGELIPNRLHPGTELLVLGVLQGQQAPTADLTHSRAVTVENFRNLTPWHMC